MIVGKVDWIIKIVNVLIGIRKFIEVCVFSLCLVCY